LLADYYYYYYYYYYYNNNNNMEARRPAFGEGDFVSMCFRHRRHPVKLRRLVKAFFVSQVLVRDGLRWSDPVDSVLAVRPGLQRVHVRPEPNAAYFIRLIGAVDFSVDVTGLLCPQPSNLQELRVMFAHNSTIMVCVLYSDPSAGGPRDGGWIDAFVGSADWLALARSIDKGDCHELPTLASVGITAFTDFHQDTLPGHVYFVRSFVLEELLAANGFEQMYVVPTPEDVVVYVRPRKMPRPDSYVRADVVEFKRLANSDNVVLRFSALCNLCSSETLLSLLELASHCALHHDVPSNRVYSNYQFETLHDFVLCNPE